jgi:radical SAM superfamily enzyme YgiQ (UPF0313 family)
VEGWPDLQRSPIPRWDLYPNDRTLVGCVQTSRGCPFECEFCDVIQYAGKQRHKSIEQVLAELDILYKYGYNQVFIADDNFTAYRQRAKELLVAIRDWNNRQPAGRLTFGTQISIDAARDDELLRLCSEAGIYYVLVGLETPNEASLREVKKRQNVGINLGEYIQRFLDYGIAVTGGMLVGFDSDDLNIFEHQYQFAMASPVPVFMLVALVASHSTPLYTRLQQNNRLSPNKTFKGFRPWYTNIVPKQMSREQLFAGIRWLSNRLYHPAAFGQRVLQFIEKYQEPPLDGQLYRIPSRQIDQEMMEAVQSVCRLGPEETRMFLEVAAAAAKKSVTQRLIMPMMFQYIQIRYMYQLGQFWEPRLAEYSAADFFENFKNRALKSL